MNVLSEDTRITEHDWWKGETIKHSKKGRFLSQYRFRLRNIHVVE